MNWVQRQFLTLITRVIAGKLFKEDSMDGSKKWYQSKTNVAGIVTFILSAYQLFAMFVGPVFGITVPPIPEWLLVALGSILGPIVVYGRTTATAAIK
jgi:hypothetical protein